MPSSYPTVASLIAHFVRKGYHVEMYQQSTTDAFAVVVWAKDSARIGVTCESLDTRMLTAALIKIKRRIEAR